MLPITLRSLIFITAIVSYSLKYNSLCYCMVIIDAIWSGDTR